MNGYTEMWASVKRNLWRWRGIWITTPSMAAAIILLRLTGALQLLEWVAYDQFFRLRPVEPADERVVLVTIGEADIAKHGWPLSDQQLANILKQIKAHKPRAIGIDFYRDRAIAPGSAELEAVFTSTPNLIGIRKVVSSAYGFNIGGPPALEKLGQVGASDLVQDADSRVRRSLLSLKDREDKTVLSLATRLSLIYLAAEGIQPQVLDAATSTLGLGKAVFTPMQPNYGGYQGTEIGGYQILANFRNSPQRFDSISISDILAGNVAAEQLNNKVVLIGTTANSLGDYYFTSYSSSLFSKTLAITSGVEIHAKLVGQMLDAALDGRPLIRSWSEPIEGGWILLWAGVGAILGWFVRSPRWMVLSLLVAGSGLVGLAYGLFLAGWWIIVVPPLLALVGAATANQSYNLWHNLKLSYRSLEEYSHTLEQRVEERTLELSQKNTLLEQEIRERKQVEIALRAEQQKSEQLLLNILPAEIAEQLKQSKEVIATRCEVVTVLFSDIVDFTSMSARLQPTDLVKLLNQVFSAFDKLAEHYGLEKIKTIGDAYMVVGGIPSSRSDHAEAIAEMALNMQQEIRRFQSDTGENLNLRIGINTGTVVAGVIGIKKFSYDLWGDTVNVASRMESQGLAGKIQVTEATYQLLKDKYHLVERGEIFVKGRGEMSTYLLVGKQQASFLPGDPRAAGCP